MRHNEFTDDLVYRPTLPLILIAIVFWSAVGFFGAIVFAVLT